MPIEWFRQPVAMVSDCVDGVVGTFMESGGRTGIVFELSEGNSFECEAIAEKLETSLHLSIAPCGDPLLSFPVPSCRLLPHVQYQCSKYSK